MEIELGRWGGADPVTDLIQSGYFFHSSISVDFHPIYPHGTAEPQVDPQIRVFYIIVGSM